MTEEEYNKEYPEFNYENIIKETPKGICIDVYGDGKGIWLPKSEVEISESDKTFNIPLWLAERNELI